MDDRILEKHPIALTTLYVFLVLFANMYGFWRPFGVNVFGYGNVLELFSNASLYVGQSVVVLIEVVVAGAIGVWALVIMWNCTTVPVLARWRGTPKRELSVHAWLKRVCPGSDELHELAVLSLLFGFVGLILFKGPYNLWALVLAAFVVVGIGAGAQLAASQSDGWPRTLTFLATMAAALLPAFSYARASYAAEAIKNGCGTVRYLEQGSSVSGNLPVYLGHVGEYVFLYDDFRNQEIAIADGPNKRFRLVHADRHGTPVSVENRAFRLYRSATSFQIPDCRDS